MDNKILTAAKKLKQFTIDDVVMMTEVEESVAKSVLDNLTANYKIKTGNDNFEYIERSVLEMLYLAPDKNSLKEIYQLMEMLNVLKPKLMQELLENCSSIKVKRLFLYIAEKLDYPWFKKIDISKIDLGKGKRVIEKGGKLDKKYNIVIGNIEEIW